MPNLKKQNSEPAVVEVSSPEKTEKEAIADIYLELPKSYKKEYAAVFKTLPPALRRYLHERESEIERGFSKINNELNAKRWIDEVFGCRAERLYRHGIKKPREWVETMAKIDDALDSDPQAALRYLSELYGASGKTVPEESASAEADIKSRMERLETELQDLRMLVQNSREQSQKLAEAQKAKDASFAPRGKNSRKDLSELSTREVLELKMAEYD